MLVLTILVLVFIKRPIFAGFLECSDEYFADYQVYGPCITQECGRFVAQLHKGNVWTPRPCVSLLRCCPKYGANRHLCYTLCFISNNLKICTVEPFQNSTRWGCLLFISVAFKVFKNLQHFWLCSNLKEFAKSSELYFTWSASKIIDLTFKKVKKQPVVVWIFRNFGASCLASSKLSGWLLSTFN